MRKMAAALTGVVLAAGAGGASGVGVVPGVAAAAAPAPVVAAARTGGPPPVVLAELKARTPGQRQAVAPARGGWEAATWRRGLIEFWRFTRAWARVGAARYTTATPRPVSPSAVGWLLPGMANATFVFHGLFTGDGSGDAMAFTAGHRGWGPLALTTADTLAVADTVARPQVAGILFSGIEHLRSGRLLTDIESPYYAVASGELYPLLTQWDWVSRTGTFAVHATNAFTARPVAAPATAPALRACPGPSTNGTWSARVQVAVATARHFRVDEPLAWSVALPGGRTCRLSAPFDLPVSLLARTSGGDRWITAPASVLGSSLLAFRPGQPIPTTFFGSRPGESPYVIPPSLHASAILSYLGLARLGTGAGSTAAPWSGTISLRAGRLVGASVAAG